MRKLVVLAALAIFIIEVPHSQAGTKVDLKNGLSGRRLIAHCGSKDDDIGAQIIEEGSSLYWRFEPIMMGKTHFWCNLAVQDKRLSFTVYDGRNHEIRGEDVRWVVRDDGAHLVKYGNTAEEPVARQKWRRMVFPPDTSYEIRNG